MKTKSPENRIEKRTTVANPIVVFVIHSMFDKMRQEVMLMSPLVQYVYESDNPADALLSHNILVHQVELCPEVAAFVYKSRQNIYHIVINSSLNWSAQVRVFLHEIKHIEKDLPRAGYVVGLDMQHEEAEINADWFAKETVRAYGY